MALRWAVGERASVRARAGGRACTRTGMVYRGVPFHFPAHLLQRLVSLAQRRPLLMPPLGAVISTQSPSVCSHTPQTLPGLFL